VGSISAIDSTMAGEMSSFGAESVPTWVGPHHLLVGSIESMNQSALSGRTGDISSADYAKLAARGGCADRHDGAGFDTEAGHSGRNEIIEFFGGATQLEQRVE
jgi:hypothetical protein